MKPEMRKITVYAVLDKDQAGEIRLIEIETIPPPKSVKCHPVVIELPESLFDDTIPICEFKYRLKLKK